MKVYTVSSTVPYASACYIVVSGGWFSVIDPSVCYADAARQIEGIAHLKPRYVLLTHAHVDHFLAIESYTELGMQVFVGSPDADKLRFENQNAAFLFPSAPRGYFGACTSVNEGQGIDIGEEVLSVIMLPGHTSGSVAYVGGGIAFVGDTVFARGYGRYDLFSGDYRSLAASIGRVLVLDGGTLLYPGHGPSATVDEIRCNFIF